jgi:hypothetical protein
MPLHLGVGAVLPDVEDVFGVVGRGGGHVAGVGRKGYQGSFARRPRDLPVLFRDERIRPVNSPAMA